MRDRRQTFAELDALLAAQGRDDLRAELGQVVADLERTAPRTTLADATRAMLENEDTYRLVFSHEMDAMSLFTADTGAFCDVNEAWERLYGYSHDEALSMTVADVSAEPARSMQAVREVGRGAASRVDVRWHRAKDGTRFPVELTCGRLRLGGRDLVYAAMRDVRERQEAHEKLARSEARFRAVIETMPDGALVHRDGRIVYVTPAALRLLGHESDAELLGTQVVDVVHPEDRALVRGRMEVMATVGGAVPVVEQRLLRRDGTMVTAEVSGLATVFDGEPAVLVVARDITARKEYEAQLVMNDRLASLGRLAASVGHELNNPLAYVLGNLTMMQRELAAAVELPKPRADRFGKYLQVVAEGARRMRDIVNDLKTLARGDAETSSPVDLSQLLDVCANMADHELRQRARLVKEYRERVQLMGNETRLGQVFLNLLVNAAQSIPPGEARAHEVRIVLFTEDGRAVIEVRDTGVGIPPAIRERIFEPFFTTKAGTGTGLGLAISHRIVTSAGGTLTCEPGEGGRGTTFRVTLGGAYSDRT
ncbi:MAG: Sensory box histidine kinase/response regulator [Labilithrix sp.]|nr:Sensory box histidine kinase/response regulator [Labilithrix sp.]